jgi:acetolactate synthase-1/3 small subunit
MSKHTLTALVENRPGVLVRAAALFSRRGFNIDSLVVTASGQPGLSRMTIVAEVDDRVLDQVTKQLAKLVNVVEILEQAAC